MIGKITSSRPLQGYEGSFIVEFSSLGYHDFIDFMEPWADEHLQHGIELQNPPTGGQSVRLFDEGDYTLFMLRWA